MDFDIGNLVYILFLAVIFILNLFTKSKKKRQQQGADGQRDRRAQTPPPAKGKSFEELLEEFTGNTLTPPPIPNEERTQPRAKPVPPPLPVYKEPSVKQWPEPKTQKEHSIMTTDFKRFEEFEDEEVVEVDYAEMFTDQDSARKAFVLSEIFQRKY